MNIIKTDVRGIEDLTLFWGQYFPETPVCSHPDCGSVAAEVDAFFPYIDDFNRCDLHSPPTMENLTASTAACNGRAAGKGSLPASSGKLKVAGITWRPPR